MTSFTPVYNLPKPDPTDKIASALESLRLAIGTLGDATERELGAAETRSEAARALAAKRSVAVQLTTSVDGYLEESYAQNVRIPFRTSMNVPGGQTRVRVHIANYNDASDTAYVIPNLQLNRNIFIGKHKMNAGAMSGEFESAPQRITDFATGNMPIPDGSEKATPWYPVTVLPNTEYLLSLSFFNPGSATYASGMSFTYRGTATGEVDKVGPVTGQTSTLKCPFTIWLEFEALADTPVLGWVGDSLLVGREARAALHDSPAWAHAVNNGVSPRIYGIAGSRMTGWNAAPNSLRWKRWAALGKCDAAIIQLGSNDVFDFVNQPENLMAEMKIRLAALVPLVRTNISDRAYYATIMPRNNGVWSAAFLSAWREWNDYLQTLPHGALGCFDFASAVADRQDPDKLAPHIVSADLVHLTSGGYALMANAVPGPVAIR